jgi:hypothetical protein
VNQKGILMGVSEDCLVKGVTTLLLPIGHLKPECRVGNTINFRVEVPPFVMANWLCAVNRLIHADQSIER